MGGVVYESLCDSQAGGVLAEVESGPPWLVAYTRPRFEAKVETFCEERGIEVFLPCYQSWRRWSDRKKLLRLPLFPSYVFIRPDPVQRQRAAQAPGLLWFVHNRQKLVYPADDEISAIRRLLVSGWAFDPLPNVKVGGEVEIVAGALRGCRGYLLSKSDGVVALLVNAINGGIRIRVPDPSWLSPIAARRMVSLPPIISNNVGPESRPGPRLPLSTINA